MDRELATIAAMWWGDIIRKSPHHDNGARDNANNFAMLLADVVSIKNEPTDEAVNKFEELLTESLVNDAPDNVWLDCDYHPGRFLSEAADAAGIDSLRFPFKTSMEIRNGEISVKEGYGRSYQSIYKKGTGESV